MGVVNRALDKQPLSYWEDLYASILKVPIRARTHQQRCDLVKAQSHIMKMRGTTSINPAARKNAPLPKTILMCERERQEIMRIPMSERTDYHTKRIEDLRKKIRLTAERRIAEEAARHMDEIPVAKGTGDYPIPPAQDLKVRHRENKEGVPEWMREFAPLEKMEKLERPNLSQAPKTNSPMKGGSTKIREATEFRFKHIKLVDDLKEQYKDAPFDSEEYSRFMVRCSCYACGKEMIIKPREHPHYIVAPAGKRLWCCCNACSAGRSMQEADARVTEAKQTHFRKEVLQSKQNRH